MTVRDAAESLIVRASAVGQFGRVIPVDEMQRLVTLLGGVYPPWLGELLTTVPLCGLMLGWQESEPEPGYDGRTWLTWSDERDIVDESIDCYPGLAILPSEYVNVASCDMGSGNPYFLCVHHGDDPPLYRIYHDVGLDADTILSGGRILVAEHLSDFLANAFLDNM